MQREAAEIQTQADYILTDTETRMEGGGDGRKGEEGGVQREAAKRQTYTGCCYLVVCLVLFSSPMY